ncbi:hypothetical protein AURDEDRAFT_177057 [Auricularia subglabra TFB-10046 SS5]|uniref:Uncharacterized protein n=1 Tax=Auricularia subglabra (strain TFB-10046 / SS5) TaxID=717982 RepID=J0CU62_AURST|nr:hypothetical protein AURDEDRAFT_177057 [Auricularia subglabra TFB-10046 SS5]
MAKATTRENSEAIPAKGAVYDPLQPRRFALTIDLKVKVESLPTWDGSDDNALQYFDALNEWARAGRNGDLIHQLPEAAPLRWTGNLKMWWSNQMGALRVEMQRDYFAFLSGLRRNWLLGTWLEERSIEFAAMHYRQRGHRDDDPFQYMNRRVFLARVLYDLDPHAMVKQVLVKMPLEWSYIIGEHHIPNTDVLLKHVKDMNRTLTSAMNHAQLDSAQLNRRLEALEAKAAGGNRVWHTKSSDNPFHPAPPAKPQPASVHYAGEKDWWEDDVKPDKSAPRAWDEEKNVKHEVLIHLGMVCLASGSKKMRPPPPEGYKFLESTVISK